MLEYQQTVGQKQLDEYVDGYRYYRDKSNELERKYNQLKDAMNDLYYTKSLSTDYYRSVIRRELEMLK